MHFDHKVTQDKYDVRSRTYYVYKCNICGADKDFNAVPNFDIVRLRKCPTCGVEDDTNDLEYLIKKEHDLEQGIEAHKARIEVLKAELDKVTAKLKAMREMPEHIKGGTHVSQNSESKNCNPERDESATCDSAQGCTAASRPS